MNLHEYQAKAIFQKFGIAVSPGKVFEASSLSLESIRSLGEGRLAVKAQVHAGGRGKAGGIKLVNTAEEAYEAAKKLIGTTLVTYQTAGAGKPIDRALIERTEPIQKELYLAIVMDREKALPCVIGSEAGGVDIETVARETPEKVIKFHFDPDTKLTADLFKPFLAKLSLEVTSVFGDAHAKFLPPLRGKIKMGGEFESPPPPLSSPAEGGGELAWNTRQPLGGEGKGEGGLCSQLAEIAAKLAQIFVTLDCSIVEVNPLGVMAGDRLLPVDAKIVLDDSALFRHEEEAKLYDPRQDDAREIEAKQFDVSYVGLDGNIGCMVNGAGLAMATMDLIKLAGGEPANFLDVGGGASKEKAAAAFKIILKDPRVKAIWVNIFGGIMRCDVIAEGILAALDEIDLKAPLVIRLEGTKSEEGRAILKRSKIPTIPADRFEDGAWKVVEAARRSESTETRAQKPEKEKR